MMGVWCFYSGMGRRLRCEKSSSPVGEIRQGCFFCHNSSPQLQNPSPLGNFPTPLKQSNKAAFSLLFPLQNPLNFIKSNRHPSKNATYRLLFEKTLSYRLHFRLRKQKIMHPIFGVHDFYIVSSKIRLWWRQCNKMRTYNSYTIIACYLQYFQEIVYHIFYNKNRRYKSGNLLLYCRVSHFSFLSILATCCNICSSVPLSVTVPLLSASPAAAAPNLP